MILVLGATGTVGQETVKALKAKGVPVTAASRDPKKAEAALGVPAVAWDFEKPASIAAALKGITALFLLTPPGTMQDLAFATAALDAVKGSSVKKIVYLSALGADQNETSAQYKIEAAIKASGIAYVILRPTFFNQNSDEGLLAGIKAGVIALPTGDGKTCFIDARDIGAVAAEVFTSAKWDGQGIGMTGPAALSYADQARIISEKAGVPVAFVDQTTDQFKAAWKSYGILDGYIEFMAVLYGFVKAGYMATPVDGVQQVLGRAPITFEQYATDYAAKFKA
jgi:uncharacterized protein YbjT (DUF2867 family)